MFMAKPISRYLPQSGRGSKDSIMNMSLEVLTGSSGSIWACIPEDFQTFQWHCSTVFLPTAFVAASRTLAPVFGTYVQLPFSFLALSTFSENLTEGLAKAYARSIFVTADNVFVVALRAVCRRTGKFLRKSTIRTVVPTG